MNLLESVFQEELLREEHILWKGQPTPKVFTRSDIVMIPISILWGSVVLFVGMFAFFSGSLVLIAFGAFFVFMVSYSIIGRILYRWWKRKNTYYAVTNKRVLVLTDLWNKNLQTAYINTIPVINKSIRSDGTGSITFGNTSFWASVNESTGLDFMGPSYGKEAPTFHDIKDAARVYETVTELRRRIQRDLE